MRQEDLTMLARAVLEAIRKEAREKKEEDADEDKTD